MPLPFRIVAACLVLMLALPPAAVSNPQGAAIRHGQVRIEGGAGQLQIRQMSQRAVIDWESFSIDQGELTRFIQPGASSAALNRVRGSAASRIEGMLRANGRVYLINPNGILIGPNGSIDVAGFVASTLDPGDRAFLRGGSMRFSGNSDAAVINLGSISALDGDVVLMGGSVLNAGELRAPNGTAALAAGNDILLAESGQERVFVRGAAGAKKSEGVTNTGTIEANIAELKAHGGNVYGIAVKNEGRVAATGVTRNGGRILLSAGGGAVRSTGRLEAKGLDGAGGRIKVDSGAAGRTEIGGTVDASGTYAAGGEIAILGNEIEVFDGALILNDGATSGGTTRIGGGLQGADTRFRNAELVTVAERARISAEATRSGRGGEIIVFSRGSLTFGGSLSVRGADGGGGGFAELSGQREVHVRDLGRQVDLGASEGPAGTLLIDPSDISVNVGPNSGLVSGTMLTDGSLSAFLENVGSLAITTSGTGGNGDITFAPGTNVSWNSANSLSFLADRDLVLTSGAKILASGFGNFSATAGRSILLSPGSEIRTTHGDLALSANRGPVPTQGNFSGISIDGATVRSLGLGALNVSGRGGDLGIWNSGVSLTGGGRISGGNGGVARIIGFGGLSEGAFNIGVQVAGAGSVITTIGSALEVAGTGGGSGAASSGNAGVFVSSLGAITSEAGGSVTIEGIGGQGGGDNQKGVWISQVGMDAGSITSGGGTLSVTGTGGGFGTASNNQGIDLAGSNTLLSAVGGSLEVFATAGSNTHGGGLRLSGLLNTTGNHPISLNADGIEILSGASVTSGTATTTLRPLTTGFAIALGGTDTATSLGLTDGELDRVNAGLLQIGDGGSGAISVTGGISPVSPLSLTSGDGIAIGAGILMGPGRGLTVNTTDPDDGDIVLSGASAVLSASGNGAILLDAARGIRIEGTAAVTTTGSGSLTLKAERSLLVTGNSLLSVEDGNLVLEANRGEAPLAGPFTGIVVLGSRLESLGSGSIRLSGTGGTGAAGGFGGGPGSPGEGGGGSGYPNPGGPPPPTVGIHLGEGTGIHSADESPGNLAIELYGTGGGGMNDSVGVLLTGSATTLSTAGRGILVQGTGGGGGNGQRNRGILFSGGLIEAADQGNVALLGNGGNGVNENDGIQMDGGATIRVSGGALGLEGYAGETLGIGVMLGIQAGDLAVDGTGSLTIRGDGSNAHGVVLGNAGASLGGPLADFVEIGSGTGGVMLHRAARASGNLMITAASGNVFSDGDVASTSGDIRIEGNDITVAGPVTANVGDVLIHFGDDSSGSGGDPSPPLEGPTAFDGMAEINQLPVAGGRVRFFGGIGDGDLLTFAGADADGVALDFADLESIERVTGTGSADDHLLGPSAGSVYVFHGPDSFAVAGVAFSAFENVSGRDGDDVFSFTGSASLDGFLDGGGGINRLDYSEFGGGVSISFPEAQATGLGEGFANLSRFVGSADFDTFIGPESDSTYYFSGTDSWQAEDLSATGIENLVTGPVGNRFAFLPGSVLRGFLDAGSSAALPARNLLDFSGFVLPVSVNLASGKATPLPGGFSGIDSFRGSASGRDLFIGPDTSTTYVLAGPNSFFSAGFQAIGFENLAGGASPDTFLFGAGTGLAGNLSGGDGEGADTLSYALFGRPVTVSIGPNKAPGIGGRFDGIEAILGSPGNDRFNFVNQSTIDFVDGGPGTDLVEINDSNLRGDHTYDITANSVSRNPLYSFNNFETLRLFLGPGNNTVNSGFFPQTQFLHAGNGFNTLNLPGVTTLDGANPVDNVYHYGFASPRPGSNDTGGLLRIARSQAAPDANEGPDRGSDTPVDLVDPATLNAQIAALGGAFSAAVVAQSVIATVDGNSYLVLRPFSLDGSGLSPSNLGLAALRENLGVAANLELAAAIGFDGPVFLFNPDGPYSIDLSEVPADPAILTVLQESLSIAAASELAAALGLPLTASITGTDGILPTGLDGSVPGPNVVLIFGEQLGAPAEAELNAAIGGGN